MPSFQPAAGSTRSPSRRPPIPHEHGAWMMLYAPLITAIPVYAVDRLPAALLVVAVTAAFCLQNVVGLLLRGRGDPGTTIWVGLYAVITVGAGAGLVVGYRLWPLLPLALPGALLFGWQAYRRRATRRQIDRSTANELATVAVLSLGAAAAQIAAAGEWTMGAATPWALFTAYFGGTVLYVKMRVAAARGHRDGVWLHRWRVGRICILYHLGLGVTIAAAGIAGDPPSVALAGVALAPALGRGLLSWLWLEDGPPPLRRIGVAEIVYGVWFSLWIGLALTRT